MELTVTAHFTKAILNAIDRQCATQDSKVEAWLRLHKLNDRLPLSVVDDIWQYCVKLTGDPLFGLRAGLNIQIGDLDVVGFLLMSCETIEDAINALIDYHHIIGEGGDFSFTQQGNECRLIYAPHFHVCRAQRVSAVMGSVINFTKWLTDDAFSSTSISFSHTIPSSEIALQAQSLLNCETLYGQVADVFLFDESLLNMPIIQSNIKVYHRMYALADEAMERLASSTFSHSVSGFIRQYPEKSREEIAELLSMSGRHLNRKIANDGLNFKLIQDRVRLELARAWLREKVHYQDIAERLGLSDERSFCKAFKRWSGITPAQYLTDPKMTDN